MTFNTSLLHQSGCYTCTKYTQYSGMDKTDEISKLNLDGVLKLTKKQKEDIISKNENFADYSFTSEEEIDDILDRLI